MNAVEEKNLEVISGLKPGTLWQMFAIISSIPRGSKNEAAVADFIVDLAKERFTVKRDNMNNVVVYLPATPGFEDRPSICLQGHLDMVCEKLKESTHDFATDSIEFVLKDGKLMANGTTLGADNGIGSAAMAAIIVDHSVIQHGPLELLFTTVEEDGFKGASALDPSLISSKLIVNLDSEEEGEFYVGCAGGGRVSGTLPLTYIPPPGNTQKCTLVISGLKGGHSGLEINLGRANAIKLLGRTLETLNRFGLRISGLTGGKKMNAIPREAEAVLLLPISRLDDARSALDQLVKEIKLEYQLLDPGLRITLENCGDNDIVSVLHEVSQDTLLQLIAALPHGVIRYDPSNPVLVETSNNLAIIEVKNETLFVTTMFRSSLESQMDNVQSTIGSVLMMAGAKFEVLDRYPAWQPRFDTSLLALAKKVYMDIHGIHGEEPEVKTIHAGLEGAVFYRMFPGAEIISFGPSMGKVHTPDEYVDVDSVRRFYMYLLALLQSIGASGSSTKTGGG